MAVSSGTPSEFSALSPPEVHWVTDGFVLLLLSLVVSGFQKDATITFCSARLHGCLLLCEVSGSEVGGGPP